LALACSLFAPTIASAANPIFPALYAFGDSLSDAGNFYLMSSLTSPLSPPYSRGRYSNGPTWAEQLAVRLRLPKLEPSIAHGTDYAIGGATTGTTAAHTATDVDLPSQYSNFVAATPVPVAGALYTLEIGANDMDAIRTTPGITQAEAFAGADQVITNIIDFIKQIRAGGMTNLLLLNLPDESTQPASAHLTSPQAELLSNVDQYFNTNLFARVTTLATSDKFNLWTLDLYTLNETIVTNYLRLGFTNATAPCWTGSFTANDGTLCATTFAGQERYVFWDHQHPTAHGHRLLAAAALHAVVGRAAVE
jgi:phospholipase/lecithinase/hemolysin